MKFPVIPKEEYAARVAKLRAKMAEKGVDLVVGFSNLLDPSAVRYLCDFSAVNESAAIVVPAEGKVTVCSGQASMDFAEVTNRLEGSELKAFPEIGEVSGFEYNFEGQMDFKDLFLSVKAAHSVKKIGILGQLIFPAVIYNKLREVFPQAEIVNFDFEFYEIREIKSPAEIECLKTCWEMVSAVFAEVVPAIREGMTEREIQAMFESSMLRAGAESYVQAFAPMVASGPKNSFISMCRSSLRKVERSEIMSLAAGVCYEGYNGIICSPLVLGEIPAKIRDAVKCAYDALNHASALLKPGVPCDVVLNAYSDYLTKYGYIEYCPYGSLHSTGMLECEAPAFSVSNRREIRENMALCIDAYFKGMDWGSFRIEDCYLVGKEGARRMTTYNDGALPRIFKF